MPGITMEHQQRVRSVLAGETVDRPPFVLWHHFRPAGSPTALATAVVDFFGRFDFDIMKVMPDLPYPTPSGGIQATSDWTNLPRLDAHEGELSGMPKAVEAVRRARPNAVILTTVFSPLATAIKLAGGYDPFCRHVQKDPDAVREGLAIVSANLAAMCGESLRRGSDGIYFATNGQGDGLFTEEEYAQFGRPFDLQVLGACSSGWINVLHMHAASGLEWRWTADYPVQVFCWSDRRTGIALREVARALPGRTVMGGIDEFGAIVDGRMDVVAQEMQDAVRQTSGRHLILAGGCSVPDEINEEHLSMARRLVDRLPSGL